MVRTRIRVRVPRRVQKGDVVEIKTLMAHPMESGQRRDEMGQFIPRHIINRFQCFFNGELIFDADLNTGISANPYLAFYVRAEQTGKFEFRWRDDGDKVFRKTATMTVV